MNFLLNLIWFNLWPHKRFCHKRYGILISYESRDNLNHDPGDLPPFSSQFYVFVFALVSMYLDIPIHYLAFYLYKYIHLLWTKRSTYIYKYTLHTFFTYTFIFFFLQINPKFDINFQFNLFRISRANVINTRSQQKTLFKVIQPF